MKREGTTTMQSCNGRGRGSDNAIMMSVNMGENAGGCTYDMRCGNNNYYVLCKSEFNDDETEAKRKGSRHILYYYTTLWIIIPAVRAPCNNAGWGSASL